MRVRRLILLAALAAPVTTARADGRNDEQNLKKLRINAEENRKVGNRAAAWAAEEDARHVEKLIEKDKKRREEGKRSQ